MISFFVVARVQVSTRLYRDLFGSTYATLYFVIFTSFSPGTMTAFDDVKVNDDS